jgi:basic membrane protein A
MTTPFAARSSRRSLRRLAVPAAAVGLLLAACGDSGKKAETATTGATTTAAAGATTVAPVSGAGKPKLAIVYSAEFKDGSWGEAALRGAEILKKEGKISDFAAQENVPPGADAERALRSYADKGFNPIVAHSFNYGDDVKKVAKDYPKVLFVYAGGFGDVKDNVSDYSQPFFEPSYLMGILGAGATTGGSVAGAGGFDIPVCKAMFNAYLEGAKLVRPATTGTFIAVGDWYDVQKAKEAALGQADKGATMYIGCGQGPTFGQIEAAKEKNGAASGYVGDMSARGDSVLVSFDWRLEKTFEQMVNDVAAGKVNPARYFEIGMKDGAMEIVVNPKWSSKISAPAKKLFDEKLAAVKAGTFTVPFKDK